MPQDRSGNYVGQSKINLGSITYHHCSGAGITGITAVVRLSAVSR
jgi:hypothetical protein